MLSPIRITIAGIDRFSSVSRGISASMGNMGRKMSGVSKGMAGALSGLTSTWGLVAVAAAGYGALKIGGFFLNAASSMETYRVGLGVLLGSQEKAQKRVQEYAEFAAKTPFELSEIVQAGRVLQTFGGDALATGKNLTMIGDMASAAQRPFNEVAMWVGRMYDAINSGRPFGEAAMRLQEMGILSGKTRGMMEAGQKQGIKGAEIWGYFSDKMGQFSGMMDQQSRTWSGLISTVKDTAAGFANDLMSGGAFDYLRERLSGLLGWFDKNKEAVKAFAAQAGGMLVSVFKGVASVFKYVSDVWAKWGDQIIAVGKKLLPFLKVAAMLGGAFLAIAGVLAVVGWAITTLGEYLLFVGAVIIGRYFIDGIKKMGVEWGRFIPVLKLIGAVFLGLGKILLFILKWAFKPIALFFKGLGIVVGGVLNLILTIVEAIAGIALPKWLAKKLGFDVGVDKARASASPASAEILQGRFAAASSTGSETKIVIDNKNGSDIKAQTTGADQSLQTIFGRVIPAFP